MRSSSNRAYGVTLVTGLLAATGVTVGVSKAWASATATIQGLPILHATVSGAELAPLAGALGVVLLASFGAVIATRGLVRRGLGVLIVAAAVVVLVSAVHPGAAHDALEAGLSAKGLSGGDGFETQSVGWRWLVLAASVLCVLAGGAVAAYGDQWATMGSRYDAPSADEPPAPNPDDELSEAEAWRAIDRGQDPTQSR
ncbi:MAG: Trp biosynthesis-associated membrane protein [Nocardioidaceae bacterium]